MLHNPEAVSFIYLAAGLAFLGGIFLGWLSTLARVVYYYRNHVQRPRLLTRDVLVKGGYSVSFLLIVLIRLLPTEQRAALDLAGNVPWALATSIPAATASLVYLYYEWFVIERNGGEPQALESSVQTNIALTRQGIAEAHEAGVKAEAAVTRAENKP